MPSELKEELDEDFDEHDKSQSASTSHILHMKCSESLCGSVEPYAEGGHAASSAKGGKKEMFAVKLAPDHC